MKIILSGVETNNKGAELMFYAILQEIERKFPDAKVYIPPTRVKQGLTYLKTNLDIKYTCSPILAKMAQNFHLKGIFNKLHLPMELLAMMELKKGGDWFLDASGFAFGDQFRLTTTTIETWRAKLNILKKSNCKIVFLPQALGPAEKEITKQIFTIINDYASIIMPREKASYRYLKESGLVDMQKVKLYTDFTSLVDGVFPSGYDHLKDGICIIPNRQMTNRGALSYNSYIDFLTTIIDRARKSGHPVYLLNHEGVKDELLAHNCKKSIGDDIEVVSGLNALEVKGLISSAYLVVTSRFHGLASALNSCVPTLATSWSHKYEELFLDYGITDGLLPLNNIDKAIDKIEELLSPDNNAKVRTSLKERVPMIKEQTRGMWNTIWSLK